MNIQVQINQLLTLIAEVDKQAKAIMNSMNYGGYSLGQTILEDMKAKQSQLEVLFSKKEFLRGQYVTFLSMKTEETPVAEKKEESKNFNSCFTEYVQGVQEIINQDFAKSYPNLEVPVLKFDDGRKYLKVVFTRNDKVESVHSFVDKTTGDIFKPATFKAPAKHARGNIFNENPVSCIDVKGNVVYLK